MIRVVLNMIYPVRCSICGDIIKDNKGICLSCKDKLPYINEPRCKKCSKPIELEEEEYCSDCETKKHHYTNGYSVWLYNEIMRKSLSEFKYYNKKEYAEFYIKETVRVYGDRIKKLAPEAVVPVPIHHSKYIDRGFNQADILARGIAKEINLPVFSHLLIRNKKTQPQKQLSDRERLLNLQEAFRFNHKFNNLSMKRVLLVDDIYTTGSTIEACTNVLLGTGVREVNFVTLCIGKGY